MTQIKLRRDTSANFTSKNPVLGVGEPAYETDTKKLKIGDGTAAYNSLAYFTMVDEFATYREKYGAPSDSIPVVNTGNSITIKAGVSIETPNGTLTNPTDITYTYDFRTDRVLFATENDYYHAYAVYYGGKEPSPVGEQIFWFNNNVWTAIAGDGTKTVFNTQKITPIAKIYQDDEAVKNVDYSSYTKISSGDAPSNMVTTDTSQTITGHKTFSGELTIDKIDGNYGLYISTHPLKGAIRFGNTERDVIIAGKGITTEAGDKFLVQGSITGTDNVTVTETTDGIQVAGLSNATIANLSGMTNNITKYSNIVSGIEYNTTEAGFWIMQAHTEGKSYVAMDIKASDGTWIWLGSTSYSTAGADITTPAYYIAAGEVVRIRHGSTSNARALFLKAKGGVQ